MFMKRYSLGNLICLFQCKLQRLGTNPQKFRTSRRGPKYAHDVPATELSWPNEGLTQSSWRARQSYPASIGMLFCCLLDNVQRICVYAHKKQLSIIVLKQFHFCISSNMKMGCACACVTRFIGYLLYHLQNVVTMQLVQCKIVLQNVNKKLFNKGEGEQWELRVADSATRKTTTHRRDREIVSGLFFMRCIFYAKSVLQEVRV